MSMVHIYNHFLNVQTMNNMYTVIQAGHEYVYPCGLVQTEQNVDQQMTNPIGNASPLSFQGFK
jgi:hypothetical protein